MPEQALRNLRAAVAEAREALREVRSALGPLAEQLDHADALAARLLATHEETPDDE